MNAPASESVYSVLVAVYILTVLGLNFITFLISDFYRKKFNQPSPRTGFIAAIILGLLLAGSLFFGTRESVTARVVQALLLTGCSVSSMISSVNLYLTMRKVRK